MNKFKIFGVAMLATATFSQAQDLEPARKAIEAEQYEKAKVILKGIIQAKPTNGKAAFLLGDIYLKQSFEDSAKVIFQKGLSAPENGKFNAIGLGQLDLDKGDVAAAKAKFDAVTKDIKKKDIEEYIYIAKAYMNSEKPDFKSALAVLGKAKAANPNDANVLMTLGDAYYGDKNQNEAYSAYRNAFQNNSLLIRAKMQLGVLLKGAKAYTEAVKAFDEVKASNANYGPLYRELAETYYLWANNDTRKYTENIAKSLEFYEKYMSLTDYSLSSRMRHADFLILAKDYKSLEKEAEAMKKLDKVNPRILRYLGYASYENGNADAAIASLSEYMKGSNKVIGGDFYYLGLAQVKKSANVETKAVDAALLTSGIDNIKKGIEKTLSLSNTLNEIGKDYFTKKLYTVSQALFEVAITNPASKNYLEDNIYYGLSVITNNRGKDAKTLDAVAMDKANTAMDNVIAASPNYQEAYLYKARINSSLDKDDIMATNYQKYVDIVVAKGAEEVTKNKAKVIESYNNMAAHYAKTDVAKAKELLSKTLELDAANTFAMDAIKTLK